MYINNEHYRLMNKCCVQVNPDTILSASFKIYCVVDETTRNDHWRTIEALISRQGKLAGGSRILRVHGFVGMA